MPCYSPLKGFKSRSTGGIVFRRDGDAGQQMEVACGQCLGCRLDRSRMWAARIVHEASLYRDNSFVTLTYADNNQFSLDKVHFQKFMKRLRKRFSDRTIRYYHCGEYGENYQRPHYHACLFNLDFTDKQLFKQNQGNSLFTSETLQKLWPHGFSTVGELTFQSAAYCARYIMKKITGARADDAYLRWDNDGVAYYLEPEYTTMSRRPGIGKAWYDKYKTDVFPSDETPIPGKGVIKQVPRYYTDMYELEDPEGAQRLQKRREDFRKKNKSEYTPERLMAKYKVKKAQIATLKRTI